MKWRSVGATDRGKVRKLNEDAFLDRGEQNLWVVADGMGGHSRGDHASQTVVRNLAEFTRKPRLADAIDDIEARILNANEELQTGAAEGAEGSMGTTVVALYGHDDHAALFWAGDSRIYRLRGDTMTRVSHDHGLVQDMLDQGIIEDYEAENHPYSNIVTRAVGIDPVLYIEIDVLPVEPGDRFLLCSDGLFKEMREPEIAEVLRTEGDAATEKLIETTLERGAVDNVSVITVDVTAD